MGIHAVEICIYKNATFMYKAVLSKHIVICIELAFKRNFRRPLKHTVTLDYSDFAEVMHGFNSEL